MLAHIRQSIVLTLIVTVFFGFAYAFAGTGVAQVLFHHQADGSIGSHGSTLIGQPWSGRSWFHGRPDDAGPYAYTPKTHVNGGDDPLTRTGVAGNSVATNLGPRSKVLVSDTKAMVAYWKALGVAHPTEDLVTTSGSGLDPDITPADALVQVGMVSKATGIPEQRLRSIIASQTHGATLGFLGEPTVDVLELNEALAKLK